ncbi:T9SS type A sorting domain-containing protein [Bacteroidota bacterium]
MKKLILLILLIYFSGVFNSYAQNVSLYAGTPQTSGQTPGGTQRLNATFTNPFGLAFDKHGFLWVTEYWNHTVLLITPDGYVYPKAGGYLQDCFKNATATTSRFSNPAGICVGPDDTIYVADQGNHVIRTIAPTFGDEGRALAVDVKAGKYTAPGAGNPNCLTSHSGYADGTWANAQFKDPVDVDCDAAGNIYVADQGNHCIRKIGINGMVTTIAGQPGVSGNVDGDALTQAKFDWPSGIYVHTDGDIYVSEFQNSQLRKISNGKVTTVLGYPPLWLPSDVYIDSRGVVYISDNHRIIKLDGTQSSVFAGGADKLMSGYINDTATAARFDDTKQMVVDPNNYHFVYVADYNNHVIRKVTICEPYKPNVSLNGGTTTFCKGASLTLTAENGYSKYLWSTGDTTKEITVTTTKDVYVKVLNADLCWGYSDTFNISVYNLKPSVTPTATSFCAGDSAYLVGQSGFDYYTWYKNDIKFLEGALEQTLVVKEAGTYTLEVISGPCKGISDPVIMTIGNLTPTLNFSGTKVLCSGDSLIAQPTGNFVVYQWKKGTTIVGTSKQYVIKEAGTYTLYAENAGGCTGTSKNLVVTIANKPVKPTISTSGDSILVSSSLTGNQWFRNDTLLAGATAPGYFAKIKGWYTVQVTDLTTGCFSTSDPFPFGGVGIREANTSNYLQLFPNPSQGELIVSCSQIEYGKASLKVYDVIGKVVFEEEFAMNNPKTNRQIDLRHLEKGIYFVLLQLNGISEVKKLILN